MGRLSYEQETIFNMAISYKLGLRAFVDLSQAMATAFWEAEKDKLDLSEIADHRIKYYRKSKSGLPMILSFRRNAPDYSPSQNTLIVADRLWHYWKYEQNDTENRCQLQVLRFEELNAVVEASLNVIRLTAKGVIDENEEPCSGNS